MANTLADDVKDIVATWSNAKGLTSPSIEGRNIGDHVRLAAFIADIREGNNREECIEELGDALLAGLNLKHTMITLKDSMPTLLGKAVVECLDHAETVGALIEEIDKARKARDPIPLRLH